jgi:putrescine---pyruvate transaminase
MSTPIKEVYDTAALRKLDAAHYLHPFTDHQALRDKGVRVMVRGEGIYLWDSESTCGIPRATRSSTGCPACGA